MIDFDGLDTAEAECAFEEASAPSGGACSSEAAAASSSGTPGRCSEARLVTVAERCARERARGPITRAPGPVAGSRRRYMPGIFYNLSFPWSPGSLRALGCEWLTEAFHAAGTLPETSAVSAIREMRCLGVRNAARQVLVEVDYCPGGASHRLLHRELLVKVPTFETSALETSSTRQTTSSSTALPMDHFMEISFYRLFEAEAPVRMPRFYYGDVSGKTHNFILITEWIPLSDGSLSLSSPQQCFLRGWHGMYLGANDADGSIHMTSKRKEHEMWVLQPANGGREHFLQTSGGSYLTTTSAAEQSMEIATSKETSGRWTLCPVNGSAAWYFLRGFHRTYLASLDDWQQSLYMSPNSKDWEKWSLTSVEFVEAHHGNARHLDLRNAGLEACSMLVAAGAALAGLQRSGRLEGAAQLLGSGHTGEGDGPGPAGGLELGAASLADRSFLERAGVAQDFVCSAAEALFPPGVVTGESMKRYRAMLVSARSNLPEMRYFCSCKDDYVALGLDHLDLDNAFLRQEEEKTWEGLRHWDCLSMGSLGVRLWRWLSVAKPDVFRYYHWDFLEMFIAKYHECGGPLLDSKILHVHFALGAVLQAVELLGVLPDIYRCCPKDEWASITSLSDARFALHRTGWGSLWTCLKGFVNIFLFLQKCDIVAMLWWVLPWVFVEYSIRPSARGFRSAVEGVEVRVGDSSKSSLLCRLPKGCLVYAEIDLTCIDQAGEELVQLAYPANGWISMRHLEALDGTRDEIERQIDLQAMAGTELLALMYNIRRQYTGTSPGGMAEISSSMLHSRFLRTAAHKPAFVEELSHGNCRVVRGSFLAQREHRSWWPSGYQDWAHHSFVAFDDGSIVDLTADQFDDLPQLWWPADRNRYMADFQKADAANRIRKDQVGIDNWTKMCEQDNAEDGATRYLWWTVEWHTTMRLVPRSGVVLRHGDPVALPPICRRIEPGNGRPAVLFRRLTAEHELQVWLVEDLFSAEETDRLVRCCEARQGFQPSLQKTTNGHVVSDNRRTSSTCPLFWPHLCSDMLAEMRASWGGESANDEVHAAGEAAKVCALAVEVDVNRIEPLQLVKYSPGQHYLPHLDAHSEPDRLSSYSGEQRVQTLLVFLSDVPEDDGGGHLHFPLLGLRVLPRKGSAVLWNNVTPKGCEPDPASLHEGVAPLGCGKIAMNVWITDRPLRLGTSSGRQSLHAAPSNRAVGLGLGSGGSAHAPRKQVT